MTRGIVRRAWLQSSGATPCSASCLHFDFSNRDGYSVLPIQDNRCSCRAPPSTPRRAQLSPSTLHTRARSPARMEPAVAQRGWWLWVFLAAVSLALNGSFAWFVYQARHSRRDLIFVIAIYYLIVLLLCCLAKLNLLRRDDLAAAPVWWRVRFAAWTVFVMLTYTILVRVDEAITDRWLKNALWWITGVGVWLAFLFIYREDAGRRADGPLLEVSPEERV